MKELLIAVLLFSSLILGIADAESMKVFALTKAGSIVLLLSALWMSFKVSVAE